MARGRFSHRKTHRRQDISHPGKNPCLSSSNCRIFRSGWAIPFPGPHPIRGSFRHVNRQPTTDYRVRTSCRLPHFRVERGPARLCSRRLPTFLSSFLQTRQPINSLPGKRLRPRRRIRFRSNVSVHMWLYRTDRYRWKKRQRGHFPPCGMRQREGSPCPSGPIPPIVRHYPDE